nr:RNA 2'-phosphotransferase [Oceanusvirus sp.]
MIDASGLQPDQVALLRLFESREVHPFATRGHSYNVARHRKRETPVGKRVCVACRHVRGLDKATRPDGHLDSRFLEAIDSDLTPGSIQEACRVQEEEAAQGQSKRRFEVKWEDGRLLVWVWQGHSNGTLSPMVPFDGDVAYHRTSAEASEIVMSLGLDRMTREYVHMSKDPHTVYGARQKAQVCLRVDCVAARAHGVVFLEAKNGVLQCRETVPPQCLSVVDA